MKAGFTQKRCPRCGGNVFLDADSDGWYEQCLQCSHTRYLDTIVETRDKIDYGASVALSNAGPSNGPQY